MSIVSEHQAAGKAMLARQSDSVQQSADVIVDCTSKSKTADKVVELKAKEQVRPHTKVSVEDAQWVLQQSAPVQQLWIECQIAERFGGKDWREVKTTLAPSTFRKAKAVLEKQALFEFRRITSNSDKGRVVVTGWLVHNLHGAYSSYWSNSCTDEQSYKQFLGSKYWKKVRKAVLKRDKCCQSCGSTKDLHVHHLTYEHHRREHEYLEDLVTLCQQCHLEAHTEKQ